MPQRFNPDRLASLEAAGWRAYYERAWLKLLVLIVSLCQEQFHIPFPVSLLAAYYTTRASIAWVPTHHDERQLRRHFEKFYRLVGRYSGLRFDPGQAAAFELDYWMAHRRLAGLADKEPYVQAVARLHTALFGLPEDQMRPSAEARVEATNVVDRITSGTSVDVAGDWRRLEECLRRCYRSIGEARDAAARLS